jgi:putative transposase
LFIEDHRGEYGVEAICTILPIAPFTYYHHQSLQRDPSRAARWAQSDAELCPKIKGSYQTSHKRYGAVKVWYDLIAVGETVARCTVVRLMKDTEIQGVTRGKGVKITQGNPALPCPEDKVNRVFNAPAPNVLWVADFKYVRTAVGFVYVALSSTYSPATSLGGRCHPRLTLSSGLIPDYDGCSACDCREEYGW